MNTKIFALILCTLTSLNLMAGGETGIGGRPKGMIALNSGEWSGAVGSRMGATFGREIEVNNLEDAIRMMNISEIKLNDGTVLKVRPSELGTLFIRPVSIPKGNHLDLEALKAGEFRVSGGEDGGGGKVRPVEGDGNSGGG
jgi:hypothetical protein